MAATRRPRVARSTRIPNISTRAVVPALCSGPQRTRKTMGGTHKKKGRLRCHKRPKSREETPKEGSDGGWERIATAYA
jgi:hypothetical protein